MTRSIIVSVMLVVITVTVINMMMFPHRSIVTANSVVVFVHVRVIMIYMMRLAIMPVPGVITPVIRRVPYHMEGIPKEIINYGTMHINRFKNVVGTVNVFITHNLHHYFPLITNIDIDGGNILKNIVTQYRLDNYKVYLFLIGFYHPQVIDISVSIKVKVGDLMLGIVEHLFKVFQIFGFTKQIGYCFQIQVITYIVTVGIYRYGLLSHQLTNE